jgi:cephalosporin hydroxylase
MTDTPGDGIVQVAYLHPEHVSHSWHDSMCATLEYDLQHGRIARKPLNIRCGSGRLVPSRNFATTLFLDRTAHEWLFFVDTDMGWEPDAIHRLLEVADPVERPVVGGLCFALMEAAYDGLGGHRYKVVPTMYKLGVTVKTQKPSFCYYGPYMADAVTPVAGTGAAFLLIHRSVLEKVRAEVGDHWWDQIYDDEGTMVGEDLSFCARLGAAGVPVHVHTGVKTNHHKEIWLQELDYLQQESVEVVEEPHPELPPYVHVGASLGTLADPEWGRDGLLQLATDLARYEQIIAATKPEVVVETGTWTGAKARWFASLGVDVITIDINPDTGTGEPTGLNEMTVTAAADGAGEIFWLTATAAGVAAMVNGRRCMVSLDSDHSAAHVAAEIDLYGPLVTPGCYLVVEDTIFAHAPQVLMDIHFPGGLEGTPLDAVAAKLHGNDGWSRDVAVERAHPTSHHPAGWWIRNG